LLECNYAELVARDRSLHPRTAEGIAAAELRAEIVRGDLAPGAKIRQELTARELGISLIPVREALRTLAGEGVVTYVPQRGYFVTELPVEAIHHIYRVRDLLETETETETISRITKEEVVAMRRHLRAQARAVDDRDAVEMIEANRRLHFEIFSRCENPWLLRYVTQLWDTIDPYRVLSYRRMWLTDDEHDIPTEILAEHEEIIDALEHHEETRALQLLSTHRQRSETFLSVLVDTAPSAARSPAARLAVPPQHE
jgi:DNA-binding GntR family transcriptional regulator